MADAGRTTRVFPNEPFDAWRGRAARDPRTADGDHRLRHRRPRGVVSRRRQERAAPRVRAPRRTTRCSSRRCWRGWTLDALAKRTPRLHRACGAERASRSRQVRLRYEAFFGQTRGALDGEWAWEDTSAAYLLLDSLALREETTGLARILFEDFAHYFTTRKPRSQFCVLIVDEFSGARRAWRHGFPRRAGPWLQHESRPRPQVVAGMGDEQEAARILGSVETVICHRVNTPEEIIALAGTRKAMEYSTQYASEGATGDGSARMQHQFKIDPNKVRALHPDTPTPSAAAAP